MDKLKITDKTYPPEMRLYKGDILKKVIPIVNFEEQANKAIDGISQSPFDAIKLKKAINLFEGKEITIEERNS